MSKKSPYTKQTEQSSDLNMERLLYNKKWDSLKKVRTHIPGVDGITRGGLPEGRATLVSGSAGSGKTIFGAQFLSNGIEEENENGVFVTFEERPEDIATNMKSFNWDFYKWEQEGKFLFVDVSPVLEESTFTEGYDLNILLERIAHAVNKVGAKRVVMDSIAALLSQFSETQSIRVELASLLRKVRALGVTLILTSERDESTEAISRYEIEDYVVDNIIVLRNRLEEEKRRRTIEVIKFRGGVHQTGEYPFAILPGRGLFSIALTDININQPVSDIRLPTGNRKLYGLIGGGFIVGSVVVINGPTGAGKTVTCCEFMHDMVYLSKEKGVYFSFEESRQQLIRNAQSIGVDFRDMEKTGLFRFSCLYPETMNLDEHLLHIKAVVDDFQPKILVLDSLTALDRIGSTRNFREFLVGLNAFVKKDNQLTIMMTSSEHLADILSSSHKTNKCYASMTDVIIQLKYHRDHEKVDREMLIVKSRGSDHDKRFWKYKIGAQGMKILRPVEDYNEDYNEDYKNKNYEGL